MSELKRGRLSAKELEYIKANQKDQTPKQMADYLNRSLETVVSAIQAAAPKLEQEDSLMKKSFARKRGATIATAGTGQLGDDFAKSIAGSPNKLDPNIVSKPYG